MTKAGLGITKLLIGIYNTRSGATVTARGKYLDRKGRARYLPVLNISPTSDGKEDVTEYPLPPDLEELIHFRLGSTSFEGQTYGRIVDGLGKSGMGILRMGYMIGGTGVSWPDGKDQMLGEIPRTYSRDKKYTAGVGAPNPGTVDFKPVAGSPFTIESLIVVVGGTKLTSGNLLLQKINAAGAELSRYGGFSASANGTIKLPAPGDIQTGTNKLADSTNRPRFYNDDYLRISLATMADTEIFTVRMRLLVYGPEDPTVAVQADLTEAAE